MPQQCDMSGMNSTPGIILSSEVEKMVQPSFSMWQGAW